MNKFLHTKNQSPVKLFIKSVVTLSFVISSHAFSETILSTGKSPEQIQYDKEKDFKDRCDTAQGKYNDAQKALGDACKKASLGNATECISKSVSCGETLGEESFGTSQVLAQVLSVPDVSSIGGSCPQMNGRDYYDEKDRLQKEIQDLEKQIAELKTEESEINDELNKTVQDLQKAISDAQDAYKEYQLSSKSKSREREAKFMEQQQKNAQNLQDISEQLLSLEIEVTNIQSQKAKDLVELAKTGGNTACLAQYQQERAKLQKAALSAKSSGSAIATAKLNNKALAEFFQTCMNDFHLKRQSIAKTASDKTAQVSKKIESVKKQQEQLNESIAAADTQLAQIKEDAATEDSNEQNKLTNLMSQTQTKMLAAQQKAQSQLQALTTKNQSLTAALNRANNSLLTLGPAPARGAEQTASQASSEISAQYNVMASITSDASLSECGWIKGAQTTTKEYKRAGAR